MTKDEELAMDLALEALEGVVKNCWRDIPSWRLDEIKERITAIKQARSAPVQEPVYTLISAWQALEETSGHVLDVGDVEGRMHMSVIRSAWEQMDSLVREMWDERGRP